MAVSRLAVTVLCGLNHAGKTALRQQLLEHHEGRRMALLTDEARCSGSNLHRQVVRLAAQRRFDHLIVEASPTADPRALAALFPHEHARLDCMVTCIAAETFLADLQSEDPVADYDQVTGQLLASQVEFSNVLTLSHTDRLDSHQHNQLRQILYQLNPIARIEDASQTPVPLAALLPTGLYESQKFALSSVWPCIAGTSSPAATDDSPHTARLVFRSHRPFHPQRFWERLQRHWPGVLRAKGFCWLATRPDHIGAFSYAGNCSIVEPYARWFAVIPPDQWPHDERHLAAIAEAWDEPFGDRMQHLTFTGIGIPREQLLRELNACLLTDTEMAHGPLTWATLPDPFRPWGLAQAAAGQGAAIRTVARVRSAPDDTPPVASWR